MSKNTTKRDPNDLAYAVHTVTGYGGDSTEVMGYVYAKDILDAKKKAKDVWGLPMKEGVRWVVESTPAAVQRHMRKLKVDREDLKRQLALVERQLNRFGM